MAEHELKTLPEFFGAVERGDKTFECRKNDRGFQRGDVLRLSEYDPSKAIESHRFTGNSFKVRVTYVLTGEAFGVKDGFCVMGIKKIKG